MAARGATSRRTAAAAVAQAIPDKSLTDETARSIIEQVDRQLATLAEEKEVNTDEVRQLSARARAASGALEKQAAFQGTSLKLEEMRCRRIGRLLKLPQSSSALFETILSEIVETVARLHFKAGTSKENAGSPTIVIDVPDAAPAPLVLLVLQVYLYALRLFLAANKALSPTHRAQARCLASSGIPLWMTALGMADAPQVPQWCGYFVRAVGDAEAVSLLSPDALADLIACLVTACASTAPILSSTEHRKTIALVLQTAYEACAPLVRVQPSAACATLAAICAAQDPEQRHLGNALFSCATELYVHSLLATARPDKAITALAEAVGRHPPGDVPLPARLHVLLEQYARAFNQAGGNYRPLASNLPAAASDDIRERLLLAEHEAAQWYCPAGVPATLAALEKLASPRAVAIGAVCQNETSRDQLINAAAAFRKDGFPLWSLPPWARLAELLVVVGDADTAGPLLESLCAAIEGAGMPASLSAVEAATAAALEALACVAQWRFSRAQALLQLAATRYAEGAAAPLERRMSAAATIAAARALFLLAFQAPAAELDLEARLLARAADELQAALADERSAESTKAPAALLAGGSLRRSFRRDLLKAATHVINAAHLCVSGNATAAVAVSEQGLAAVRHLLRDLTVAGGLSGDSATAASVAAAARSLGGATLLLWELVALTVRARVHEHLGQAEQATVMCTRCRDAAAALMPSGDSPMLAFMRLPLARLLLRRGQLDAAALVIPESGECASLAALPLDLRVRASMDRVDLHIERRETEAAAAALDEAAAMLEVEGGPPPTVTTRRRAGARRAPPSAASTPATLERSALAGMLQLRAAFVAALRGQVERADELFAACTDEEGVLSGMAFELSRLGREASSAPLIVGLAGSTGTAFSARSAGSADDISARLRALRLRGYRSLPPYRLAPLLRMEAAAAAHRVNEAAQSAAVAVGLEPGIAHRRQMLAVLERRGDGDALRELYLSEGASSTAHDLAGELPEGLAVCTLGVDVDPFTDEEVLVLTRLTGGAAAPLTARVPTSGRLAGTEGARALMARLADIVQRSDETIERSFRGGATAAETKAWWATRDLLDAQLRHLCVGMQTLLGGFRAFLLGVRADEDDGSGADAPAVLDVQAAVAKAVAKAAGCRTSSAVRPDADLCALFAELAGEPDVTDADLRDILVALAPTAVPSLSPAAAAELPWEKVLTEFRRAFSAAAAAGAPLRHHVVLVLDRHLQRFPFESMPCLAEASVSRLPTLAFLRDRLRAHADGVAEADASSAFYVINASRDLDATQQRLEPHLAPRFSGIGGRPPTSDEWIRAVTQHDVFLYMAHGSGLQYVRSERLHTESSGGCAVAVLMGCQSGHLRDQGAFDPSGDALQYLYAGSPAVVGTLWDVTSTDLDLFTVEMLRLWGLLPDEGDRDDEGCMLTVAVAEARSVCRYRALNAGAVVVYGLPVMLTRRAKP